MKAIAPPLRSLLLLFGLLLSGCATGPVAVAPVETPAETAVVAKRPPRIGLALGGGAARGFALVGVIQVLEEAGVRPDMVVGVNRARMEAIRAKFQA